jgi:hypothetical protein
VHDNEIKKQARDQQLYVVNIRSLGKFVPGAETLRERLYLMTKQQHDELMRLMERFSEAQLP